MAGEHGFARACDLCRGMDLLVHALRSRLKHESHVAPGGNYDQMAVSYEGIEGLSVAEDASLLMGFGGDGVRYGMMHPASIRRSMGIGWRSLGSLSCWTGGPIRLT